MISLRARLTDTNTQLLLLWALVLCVFSPAFFAEISNIDDADLIADLARKSTWSFNELFGPGSASGLYYRPIIGLTHYADRFLFNLNPVILHAENILLHAANATLVFFLTRFFLQAPGGSFAALFAASLFAVHPLTTESTNWISGRTDVLAGVFVLASALSLIRYQSRKDPFALLLFACFFIVAMLTKEVALAFLPGACLLFLATQGTDSSGKRSLKQAVFIVALGVLAILMFFWLRSLTAASNQSRIGLTLMVISNDFWYSLYICLRSLGFYFAKIVAPVPLNFAIMEVDPLYALAGVPLACISIFTLFRKGPVSALFSSGLFLIAPAFLIAFGQIAWTPYAERYLYMPLMFIIPAFVLFFNKHLVFSSATLKKSLCLALVLVFSALTFNRNLVWRTNETLISDTLEKSPLSGRLWSVYAGMALSAGSHDEALVRAHKASRLLQLPYDERPDLIIAEIYVLKGDIEAGIDHYGQVLKKTDGKSAHAKQGILDALQAGIDQAQTTRDRERYTLLLSNYKKRFHTESPSEKIRLQ